MRTQETALHAEDNMLRIIQRLGLEPNSRAAVGVSRRLGLCDRCFGNLGAQFVSQLGRGVVAALRNNIHVVIMGVK